MPFAGYRDFDDCVARNQDRDNPEAYCATIMRQVEGAAQGTNMREFFRLADGPARDGDWVRAKPMGWDLIEDNPDVIVGGAAHAAPLTGLLTIIKSSIPGVSRYSVAGITVDPNTISVVTPPPE